MLRSLAFIFTPLNRPSKSYFNFGSLSRLPFRIKKQRDAVAQMVEQRLALRLPGQIKHTSIGKVSLLGDLRFESPFNDYRVNQNLLPSIHNPWVVGSSPTCVTKKIILAKKGETYE